MTMKEQYAAHMTAYEEQKKESHAHFWINQTNG